MTEFFTPMHLIFYLFAVIAVCSGIAVITVRHPVRSVLSLVVTFFAMAGIWMMLRAEFLSLILVLVYVGAVMTLFLFVVMMLNIDVASRQGGFVRYLPFGLIMVILLIGLLAIALGPTYFGLSQMPLPKVLPADYSNVEQLGELLYTDYAYPFEIAGVILLVAIIAAITLAFRGARNRKVQMNSKQIAVDPRDRIHVVKMASEPKQKGT
jgi:NADH-quinone oxidoreductase subunit J